MSKLDTFIQHAVNAVPVSGTSLISSLYGDSLSHRGGEIWLGSLAALLEGLGFGERFVRTALFRLNKEGWLDVSRIGRRSFYSLSDKGLRLTRRAESKIYRAEQPAWDGKWLLLLSEGLDKTTLADVKKQLIWQGFGALAPSLMASPSQKLADVQALLHEAGVADNVICFEAQIPLALSRAALRARVEECWHFGHSAILHGCIIRRNALVGMNAVVMDGAVIGENSIVGASAFVKAKAEMPANYLIVGSPAKAIRELSEQELAWKKQGTHEYQVLVTRCKQTLHQVEPLREIEPGRKRLVFDENLRPKQ